MKLRFDHQSLRLRVRKSDVEKLSQDGFVEETVQFPLGRLVYRLEIGDNVQPLSASMEAHLICVRIPADEASEWINTENVGIYGSLHTDVEKKMLEILIEKDFPCKHGSTADNADSFEELSQL
jgi:hypothetical protein